MSNIAEQGIVTICNKIVCGDRFTTLDDIRRQPTITIDDTVYNEVNDVLVSIVEDLLFGGYSCRFLNTLTSDLVTIFVGNNGGNFSYGSKKVTADSSIAVNSTGVISMEFPGATIVYAHAKSTEVVGVGMGWFTFYVPKYDDRLFDRAIYMNLFDAIYSSSNEEYTMSFYIDRHARKAIIKVSKVIDLSTVAELKNIRVDFSNGIVLSFQDIEASKEASITEIITPLINAAT